jgi:SAM-dependent methyltransferase
MQVILLVILIFVAVKYIFITAPFVPVKKVDLNRIGQIVEKYKIKNFLDLGCGSGRVLAYLNKSFSRLKLTGIELSAWSYVFCRTKFLFKKKVEIKWGNFFWYDWSAYDGLFLFWIPRTVEKTRQKLENKLKSGQILISYCFEIKWLKEKLVEENRDDKHLPIFIYKI